MNPIQQIPGVYHRRVGELVVTALSDGYLDGSNMMFRDLSEDEARAAMAEELATYPPRISVNTFLVRAAGQLALIDTGSGNTMGDTLGRLPASLAAAGVAPREIDRVLLTHMHPDHSAGLIDADGAAAFERASVVVGESDHALWHDDAAMAMVDQRRRTRYFEAARRKIAPYDGRVVWAEGEVFPGVTAVPLPGHTPGHTGYMIASGDERLFVWGDIVHVPAIQVPRPQMAVMFDWEPERAIETRRRTLEIAAAQALVVAGMHIPFPGFARIGVDGGRYRMVAEPWEYVV